MSPKHFLFSIVDMRAKVQGDFTVEGATLDAAFKAGLPKLPAAFADKQIGLRMFRFRFQNGRTGEFSAIIGQGETVVEAWGDAMKLPREQFRPKNDGRRREANGLSVLLPSPGDGLHAKATIVSRSIESFQSDETYLQERDRLAKEAELKQIEAAAPKGAAA